MNDDTLKWVIPALSLGYTISPDGDGRLCFELDEVVIVYRDDYWIANDRVDPPRQYSSLKDALTEET